MARGLTVPIKGLKELDEALGELTKATARNALRRALAEAAEPIRDEAIRRAPVRTGALKKSLHVRTKVINTAGKKEYAQAMKSGQGRAAAVKAMRDARRAGAGKESFAEVYVQTGRQPHATLQEFGTAHHAAQPFLGPALDSQGMEALRRVRGALSREIEKARQRAARKAARATAKATTVT